MQAQFEKNGRPRGRRSRGITLYATAVDAPGRYSFSEAKDCAQKLDAHGHADWRVPTKDELNVLFNHRAAIGGFKKSSAFPAEWYWSSSQHSNLRNAEAMRFGDGGQAVFQMADFLSLRCVRG
jgi:hypothetical protein